MPEGDTLYRAARWLHEELAGGVIDALWIRGRGLLPGGFVTEVRALGKHVLLGIAEAPKGDEIAPRDASGAAHASPRSGGAAGGERDPAPRADAVLHFHLGMYGKIRRYDAPSVFARETAVTSLWLARGAARWIVFRAMTAELLRRSALGDHPQLARLGPDVLAPQLDLAALVGRARAAHRPTVADLLVDQVVAAGIGNRWKCEALWHERVHPRTPPERLGDDQLLALYRRARELMADAVARGGRDAHFPVMRGAPHHRSWVYGREGKPCPACGTPIRVARMGDDARGVWWCPRCQPGSAEPSRI
jgi:formamidopyrimidine-DNA glycosylase